MSLEKKAEALLEASTNLMNAVADLVGVTSKPSPLVATSAEKKAPTKASDKKAAKELAEAVKVKAGDVMENCGRDKLTALLGQFGVSQISKLKPGAGVFEDFISRAEEMLKAEADSPGVDPMDDSPVEDPTTPTITMDDVKEMLKKVKGHPELGNNFLIGIFDKLKVKRLGELKPTQFEDALKLAEDELYKVAK